MFLLSIDQWIQVAVAIGSGIAGLGAICSAVIARMNSKDAWKIATLEKTHVCEIKCKTGLARILENGTYGDILIASSSSDSYKKHVNDEYTKRIMVIKINNICDIPVYIEQIGIEHGSILTQLTNTGESLEVNQSYIPVGGTAMLFYAFDSIIRTDDRLNFVCEAILDSRNAKIFVKTTFDKKFTCNIPDDFMEYIKSLP